MSQMQEKAVQAKSTGAKASKQQAIQRKPSKWRKIGGLFRAKTAMTPAKQPFYQFRPNESRSHIQCALETNPISNTEVWPCLASGQAQQSDGGRNFRPGAKPAGDTESLLTVDIPDVQMERYSVMFSGLLTREPSTRKRRSKTLEDVRPANTVERSISPELRPPPRRQTTEAARSRSKSPSFSLFPSVHPNRSSKLPGSTLPRDPSPLHRSQSSLLEAYRENPPIQPRQPSPAPRSSPQKAPVSHKPQFSESSILTFTSLEGDDKIILQGVKPVQTIKDEPAWEFINKNPTPPTKQEIGATLKVNTQELPPPKSEDINSAASSPILSPLSSVTANIMTSPSVVSKPAISPSRSSKPAISPSVASKPAISPAGSARMPLADDNDNDSDDEDPEVDFDLDKDTEALKPEQLPIPTVEVSIARSVSVSRGKKQIIVPIGPRADRLTPDERLVDRKARMVRVTDGQHGHRHGNSQDVRIEMA
ncbi:hypothetical protein P168DRAFT_289172 [Aspergillus campestris IBT 28561]|uniref:Uncharacterized protein n=1 Tax=Aspergillus campestris (strain IBT 28561) TaxID=1392248 RepID=A0A2I1D777_ASPC2|nr:uncharacterized protein P168DRAFT_289172 [Aspergillus campestris IBT 28561]PKY05732.1 hypothetical protein P168DRAFT_289172 [Aspergillus campestris IBT 28561]